MDLNAFLATFGGRLDPHAGPGIDLRAARAHVRVRGGVPGDDYAGKSVRKAVAVLERAGTSYALIHTTNLYPTPPHLVRLGAMTELMRAFPDAVVGLSDHTTDNLACLGAVALGASILERHFTDSMSRPGPDIVCSMDPHACRELIAGAQVMHAMRGGKKEPAAEERVTMDFAFATVVTMAAWHRPDSSRTL